MTSHVFDKLMNYTLVASHLRPKKCLDILCSRRIFSCMYVGEVELIYGAYSCTVSATGYALADTCLLANVKVKATALVEMPHRVRISRGWF